MGGKYYPLIGLVFLSIFAAPNAAGSGSFAPSLSGETGVLRVVSAQGRPLGAVSVIGSGQFFRTSNLQNPSPSLSMTNTQWEGNLGASYSALNVLEVFFTEQNSYQAIDTGAGRREAYALGDLTFGIQFGIPLSSLISIGADASMRFLSNVGVWGYDSSATSWGGKALLSVFPPDIPLRAHLNLGYWQDNSSAFSDAIQSGVYRYALKIDPNRVLGTVGFEVPLLDGFLIPILEYSTEISSGVTFGENPHRITPGIRIVPRPSLAVTVGVDTSLTSSGTTSTGQKITLQPPWNAIISMSYVYLPERGPAGLVVPEPLPPAPAQPPKKGAVLLLEKGKIELAEPLLFFEYDETKLMPGSFWLLDSVAEILKTTPSLKIRIEGHTDNTGGERYNNLLSQGRVDSVRNYLLTQGVSIDRMEAVGFGQSRPVADNATPEGRARNRRVEFTIIPQEIK